MSVEEALHTCLYEHFAFTGAKMWIFKHSIYKYLSVAVVERSKACVCGRLPAVIVGSIPAGGHGISVSSECCVFSDRILCDDPITRPEESYRPCYVVLCDPKIS